MKDHKILLSFMETEQVERAAMWILRMKSDAFDYAENQFKKELEWFTKKWQDTKPRLVESKERYIANCREFFQEVKESLPEAKETMELEGKLHKQAFERDLQKAKLREYTKSYQFIPEKHDRDLKKLRPPQSEFKKKI